MLWGPNHHGLHLPVMFGCGFELVLRHIRAIIIVMWYYLTGGDDLNNSMVLDYRYFTNPNKFTNTEQIFEHLSTKLFGLLRICCTVLPTNSQFIINPG